MYWNDLGLKWFLELLSHVLLVKVKYEYKLHLINLDWSNSDRELQNRFLQNRQFVASYSSISEQANRLGIGTSDLFIASYSHYQVKLSSHFLFNLVCQKIPSPCRFLKILFYVLY